MIMLRPAAYFWKKTPFLRLVLAMMTGILIQWYIEPGSKTWWLLLPLPALLLIAFFFIPFFRRYQLHALTGIAASWIFACLGGLITAREDIRQHDRWFAKKIIPGSALLFTIEEPLVEKAKSYKCIASATIIINGQRQEPVRGKVILYFQKDSLRLIAGYGSQVMIGKPLQLIKGPGNPGGFDYRQYCLFRGITHQVFLAPEDYVLLPGKKEKALQKFIYSTREHVLNILRKYIPGDKEPGLAEALLIGYKDDLDKTLVQSYANTGVVHIIAVSGLHLGLIYWLLQLVFKPLRKRRQTKWLLPVLVITGLWIFSLLAGAQPSVLRSALMFTCIVVGESLDRKISVFNTMAVSAFILLCINPFLLWDVGFQLSYAAVASIIIFIQPVSNWFYFKNKIVDMAWKMNAVTIAAQILTIPFTIYHFHQFPTWFLVTNFVAVPLSSIILLGEIFLCAISILPAAGHFTGKILSWLITQMNNCIEWVERLPFALVEGMQINLAQAVLLLLFTGLVSWWLLEREKAGLKGALLTLFLFFSLSSIARVKSTNMRRLIIYDLPKKSAVDIIDGKKHLFIGDSTLVNGTPEENFHLKPARTHFSVTKVSALDAVLLDQPYVQWYQKRILFAHPGILFSPGNLKPVVDLVILSGNKPRKIKALADAITIRQVVADGSVPAWKIPGIENECRALNIPFHAVSGNGAFVMKP